MVESILNKVYWLVIVVGISTLVVVLTASYHQEVPLFDCPQQKGWTTHRSVTKDGVYCFLLEDSFPRRVKYTGIAHVYY